MNNPQTDAEALQQILNRVSKAEIARHLGVSRQLTSRWSTVPIWYAQSISEWLEMPLSQVIPDIYHRIYGMMDEDIEVFLPALIRMFYPENRVSRETLRLKVSIAASKKGARTRARMNRAKKP